MIGGLLGQGLGGQRGGPDAAPGRSGIGSIPGGLTGGHGAPGGGLLAVLGGLAQAAMQGQAQPGIAPRGEQTAAEPLGAAAAGHDDPAAVQCEAVLVLRSMLHAAQADGHIDAREMDLILGQLDAVGEDREARDFVLAEMRGPADPDAVARAATGPVEAAQAYAAALMAIEADAPVERDYLARLAAALKLPQEAVARIHGALGVGA